MHGTSSKKLAFWSISILFWCFASRIRADLPVAYDFWLLMNVRRMRDRMTKRFCYLTMIVTAGDKFKAEKLISMGRLWTCVGIIRS